jgi:hypothetical protein
VPGKQKKKFVNPKEAKPHVVALRLSERAFDELVLEASRRNMKRGTLAAELLEAALQEAPWNQPGTKIRRRRPPD